MRVIANGKAVELPDASCVTDLLAQLGLDKKWVVVERNGEPVDRKTMHETSLSDGDRIELVKAVAGG